LALSTSRSPADGDLTRISVGKFPAANRISPSAKQALI